MRAIKRIKEIIVEFNSKRTMPDFPLYEYKGSLWGECYPTISEPKFIDEIDESPYQYKYVEYKQASSGKWVKTRRELFSDVDIKEIK